MRRPTDFLTQRPSPSASDRALRVVPAQAREVRLDRPGAAGQVDSRGPTHRPLRHGGTVGRLRRCLQTSRPSMRPSETQRTCGDGAIDARCPPIRTRRPAAFLTRRPVKGCWPCRSAVLAAHGRSLPPPPTHRTSFDSRSPPQFLALSSRLELRLYNSSVAVAQLDVSRTSRCPDSLDSSLVHVRRLA